MHTLFPNVFAMFKNPINFKKLNELQMVEGMLTVLKNLNFIRFKDLNKYIAK